MTARGWRHDDLARDLGEHLVSISGRLAFLNMQLGPSGSPRPDVYSIAPSYVRPNPIAYEIKVTRSDFMSDTGSGKWMAYTKFASGVVFAVPRGLVDKTQVPNGCGLMIRGENGWTTLRRPTLARIQIPNDALLKLLFDSDRARVKHEARPRSADEWRAADAARKRVGKWVASIIADQMAAKASLNRVEEDIKRARATLKKMDELAQERSRAIEARGRELAEEAWRSLENTAGLPRGSSHHKVLGRIRELRHRVEANSEVAHLARCIEDIRRALERAAPPQLEEPPDD